MDDIKRRYQKEGIIDLTEGDPNVTETSPEDLAMFERISNTKANKENNLIQDSSKIWEKMKEMEHGQNFTGALYLENGEIFIVLGRYSRPVKMPQSVITSLFNSMLENLSKKERGFEIRW